MQKEFFAQWNDMSKTALEPMMKLNQIASRVAERLSKQQMAITKDCLDTSVKQLQTVGQAKGMQDVVQNQTALYSECGEKFKAYAQQTLELIQETQAELSSLMQDAMKQVSDKVTTATAAAATGKKAA